MGMRRRSRILWRPRETLQERRDRICDERELQFYIAGLSAYYNTSFEFDKSILTLSAAGIGLMITLISSETRSLAGNNIYWALGAMISFTLSLILILGIFRANKSHIIKVVNSNENRDKILILLDNLALCSFGAGIIFSVVVGISFSLDNFSQESKMSDKSVKTFAHDSVHGIAELKPQLDNQKSISGVAALKPQQSSPIQNNQKPTSAGDKK